MKNYFRGTLLLITGIALAAVTVGMAPLGAPRESNRGDGDNRDGGGLHRHDDFDWDDQEPGHHRESYAIGLWGDMPYSDVQVAGVLNLIQDMNAQNLAFTVHNGDLKAGSGTAGSSTPTTCSDDKYVQALGFFALLRAPAGFTPGDNDWVDCDVAANGPFNSLERLDHERGLFFSFPYMLGQRHLRQAVQTDTVTTPCLGFLTGSGAPDKNGNGLDPGTYKNVPCVENRRWTYRGVTYATLNIQGSCDNRCKDHPDPAEADARRNADVAWMQETFEVALERDSAAVMFISQADPGFNDHPIESENKRDPKTLARLDGPTPDGFDVFLKALRERVIDFHKPVAYVHGDTHYLRIDKPFLDSQGKRLENFTRIETFGDNAPNGTNDVNWVKVLVNPDSREVFAIQPQIVPANIVTHPIP